MHIKHIRKRNIEKEIRKRVGMKTSGVESDWLPVTQGVKLGEVQIIGGGSSRFHKELNSFEKSHLEELKAATPVEALDSNPNRYPSTHEDPYKGQLFEGECNRTACTNLEAIWWNMGTYGLYCTPCARAINHGQRGSKLCIVVEAKPKLEEMENFKRENGYYDIKY